MTAYEESLKEADDEGIKVEKEATDKVWRFY